MYNLTRIFTIMALSLLSSQTILAQTIITFEDIEIGVDTFWNGSDQSGGFMSENVFFPNVYVTDFGGYWASGWALSSRTDTEDATFNNLYSAKPGMGTEASQQYVIGQQDAVIEFTDEPIHGQEVSGLYLTNTTYAHGVIRDGNMFSKKFGGETGDDPDFFKLTIKKQLSNGELSTDSVDFYLADYRFDDNDMDYIVEDWTWVDLSSLGELSTGEAIIFSLSSSDFDENGMLTPSFFALDDLTIDEILSVKKPLVQNIDMSVYPNPTTDVVALDWTNINDQTADITIFDTNGRLVSSWKDVPSTSALRVNHLSKGMYVLRVEMETFYVVKKLQVK